MSEKQKQSNSSDSEQVSRAAELYTHIDDVLDAEGQIHGFVHYHLGFQYATEQLADKLEGLGVDSSWHVLDVCCGWGVPTRYVAGRRDAAKIAQYIEACGKDAHLAALEREKMDIHFAQGKMELGRFVCLKPA